MSLILEALRKSEAERRLGSAPDLLRAMPVMRASAPRSRWPLATAAAVVLLAILALAWWWMHGTPPSPPTSTRIAAQEAQPTQDSRIDNNVSRSTSSPAVVTQLPRIPDITLPVTKITTPAAPLVIPPPAPHVAAMAAPPAIQPATVPTIPAAIAPAPTALALPTPADEPALLSLAALGADERNGLPTLKVSMHVYADDPTRRFMIIDGQRVGEGARLADGVILVCIRRDGAELDVHGRRLLLPKP